MSLESLSATLGERMLTNLVNNSMAGSNNTTQPQNGPQNTSTQGFPVSGPPPPTNLTGYYAPVGGTYAPAPPFSAGGMAPMPYFASQQQPQFQPFQQNQTFRSEDRRSQPWEKKPFTPGVCIDSGKIPKGEHGPRLYSDHGWGKGGKPSSTPRALLLCRALRLSISAP